MLASGAVVELADAKSLTGEAMEAEELDCGFAVGGEMVMPTEEQTPWAKARVSGWKSVSAAVASVVGAGVGRQVILWISLSLHTVAICPCNAARNAEELQRQW